MQWNVSIFLLFLIPRVEVVNCVLSLDGWGSRDSGGGDSPRQSSVFPLSDEVERLYVSPPQHTKEIRMTPSLEWELRNSGYGNGPSVKKVGCSSAPTKVHPADRRKRRRKSVDQDSRKRKHRVQRTRRSSLDLLKSSKVQKRPQSRSEVKEKTPTLLHRGRSFSSSMCLKSEDKSKRSSLWNWENAPVTERDSIRHSLSFFQNPYALPMSHYRKGVLQLSASGFKNLVIDANPTPGFDPRSIFIVHLMQDTRKFSWFNSLVEEYFFQETYASGRPLVFAEVDCGVTEALQLCSLFTTDTPSIVAVSEGTSLLLGGRFRWHKSSGRELMRDIQDLVAMFKANMEIVTLQEGPGGISFSPDSYFGSSTQMLSAERRSQEQHLNASPPLHRESHRLQSFKAPVSLSRGTQPPILVDADTQTDSRDQVACFDMRPKIRTSISLDVGCAEEEGSSWRKWSLGLLIGGSLGGLGLLIALVYWGRELYLRYVPTRVDLPPASEREVLHV